MDGSTKLKVDDDDSKSKSNDKSADSRDEELKDKNSKLNSALKTLEA